MSEDIEIDYPIDYPPFGVSEETWLAIHRRSRDCTYTRAMLSLCERGCTFGEAACIVVLSLSQARQDAADLAVKAHEGHAFATIVPDNR